MKHVRYCVYTVCTHLQLFLFYAVYANYKKTGIFNGSSNELTHANVIPRRLIWYPEIGARSCHKNNCTNTVWCVINFCLCQSYIYVKYSTALKCSSRLRSDNKYAFAVLFSQNKISTAKNKPPKYNF